MYDNNMNILSIIPNNIIYAEMKTAKGFGLAGDHLFVSRPVRWMQNAEHMMNMHGFSHDAPLSLSTQRVGTLVYWYLWIFSCTCTVSPECMESKHISLDF